MVVESSRLWMTSLMVLVLVQSSRATAQVEKLFENDQVRVYEVEIRAGVTETGFHKHAVPYVFYVLGGGRARIRFEAAPPQEVTYEVGQAGWGDAEMHAVDNIGASNIRVLIVDLKTTGSQRRHGGSARRSPHADDEREGNHQGFLSASLFARRWKGRSSGVTPFVRPC